MSQASIQTRPLVATAERVAVGWGPTAGRILLGLVLAWFGYHELTNPSLWTGYVPAVGKTSAIATILVLGHGWLLLVLAVALMAGILPRLVAGITAILILQIVISLTVTGGLSDLTMRDIGVLGLAVCLTGKGEHRLVI
ncbi:MAG TPA: hypothetical protein VN767_21345 [Streptosporangiaceae bacterium]|jgi:uncharacterized membrane protein YphA (DoxX/SURF4 family)|nr:hypothetical protein [Streptosporangiaceae bacterium]